MINPLGQAQLLFLAGKAASAIPLTSAETNTLVEAVFTLTEQAEAQAEFIAELCQEFDSIARQLQNQSTQDSIVADAASDARHASNRIRLHQNLRPL